MSEGPARPLLLAEEEDIAGWDVPDRPYYYPFSLPFESIIRRYPPAGDYFETCWRLSREELDALQTKRLLTQVARAWSLPFYRGLWADAGVEPGDIRSVADIGKLPIFSVYDLRRDIEEHPPFGTFQGVTPDAGAETPLRLVTSGGTTGIPRPMIYTAWDREVSAIVGSRVHHAHGLRPGMVAQIVNGLSTVNGGIYQMECIWKYCGAIPITTGGGNATPTDMQIAMAREYGSEFIDGFPDYIRRLGSRAVELGMDPAKDLNIRYVSTMLGRQDGADLAELFGAEVYDSYGISEVGGYVSTECRERSGRHVMEDAYVMEVVDRETLETLPAGEPGSVVVTSLFKVGAPMIRYNTNDLSTLLDARCECGSHTRLQGPVLGRTDDLVKVKGMWVHPEGVGEVIAADERTDNEYVCILERREHGAERSDQMRVLIETAVGNEEASRLERDISDRLRARFGVTLEVETVELNALESMTLRSSNRTGKARRLVDQRVKAGSAR